MLKFGYASGTNEGSYTVPSGALVVFFTVKSAAGGSFTITPGGAGNTSGVAGSAITLAAGDSFARDYRTAGPADVFPLLGAGTIFTFTTISSWYVELAS